MNVILTGATGFLGKAVLDNLVQESIPVCVIARKKNIYRLPKSNFIKVIEYDLFSSTSLGNLLEGYNTLIYAAGVVTDWANPEDYYKVHVTALQRMLNEHKKILTKVILISTIDVEQHIDGIPTKESANYSNSNVPYIRSKVQAEKLVISFCKEAKIPFVIFRPAWLFGKGDNAFFPEIKKQLYGGIMFYVKSKNNHVPLVSVNTIANNIVTAAKEKYCDNTIINACESSEMTWGQLVKTIGKTVNRRYFEVTLPYSLSVLLSITFETIGRLMKRTTRPMLTKTVVEMLGHDLLIDNSLQRFFFRFKENDIYSQVESTIKKLH